MSSVTRLDVPPMSARALIVKPGDVLRIMDVSGGQAGDLVAFNAQDLSESLSQARTRVENRACRVTAGHDLWTSAQPPRVMFSIERDTGHGHDLLYTACCRYALEKRFGVSKDGCLENLAAALAPWGLGADRIPDPLNLFFNVAVLPGGALSIERPLSGPGAMVELRARLECLVAVATCAVPRKDRANGPYAIEVEQ